MKKGIEKRHLGSWGEERAAEFLRRKGYKVLERNFRCPAGEVDIVAWEKGVLVFVEVKTRRGLAFGYPSEAVTPAKRKRLQRIAEHYIRRRGIGQEIPVRFDVVSLIVSKEGERLELIKDAFGGGLP